MAKALCENCLSLSEDVKGFDIGPDVGTQRDPAREQLRLCQFCRNCLTNHDLAAFVARYKERRSHVVTSKDAKP